MEVNQNLQPENWVEKYGNYLYNYAISKLFNQELAKDLVQETFVSALSAIENFQGRSSEKTWLVSILKHKIIDYFRKKGRNKETDSIDTSMSEDQSRLPFIASGEQEGAWKQERYPQRWRIDSADQVENEEFKTIFEKCIGNLPEKWATVFSLKIIEEVSSDEICKEVEISPSNLWVILHRARLQLRECIEKLWSN